MTADTATASVRVPRPLLFPLRAAWVALALAGLTIWIVGIPLYHHQAETLTNINGFINRNPAEWRLGLRRLGLSPQAYAAISVAGEAILAWPAFIVGVLIFLRKSDEVIGLYIATVFVLFGTTGTNSVAIGVEHAYPSVAHAVDLLDNVGFMSFFLIPLIFPNGRLVPRWPAFLVGVFLLDQMAAGLFPGSALDSNTWPDTVNNSVGLALLFSLLVSPVYRYIRVSTAEQRQQTKWVMFGLVTFIGTFAVAAVSGSNPWFLASPVRAVLFDLIVSTSVSLAFLFVPISFAVAIFRYRLWEIDSLINHTLVYVSLTVSLVGVYILGVVAVQAIFRAVSGQDSQVAVAIATLGVAALFNPWRTRVQRFIDRRFYRRKYDSARILSAFSAHLRDEVDLETLSNNVLAVVQDTVEPSRAALWLKPAERNA